MSFYIASPMSRQKIRALVTFLRKSFDLQNDSYFPVVEFLEWGMTDLDPKFSLEILPENVMKNQYGITFPEKNLICLREDVYENAISGISRDRFTVAHEIGHYLMHRPGRIALARNEAEEDVPAYKSPEWQANTFAGELLAPPHIIKGLSPNEIALKCGVSFEVAKIQRKNC